VIRLDQPFWTYSIPTVYFSLLVYNNVDFDNLFDNKSSFSLYGLFPAVNRHTSMKCVPNFRVYLTVI